MLSGSGLTAAGFQEAAHWELDLDGQPHLIGQAPIEPGVYAFIVNDEIYYVGAAQRGLRARLRKYANLKNRGVVAARIRGLITGELRSGRQVTVLAIAARRTIAWEGLPINLIAGLEEGLIRDAEPQWNLRGLGAMRRLVRTSS
jgi:hypothetical protein